MSIFSFKATKIRAASYIVRNLSSLDGKKVLQVHSAALVYTWKILFREKSNIDSLVLYAIFKWSPSLVCYNNHNHPKIFLISLRTSSNLALRFPKTGICRLPCIESFRPQKQFNSRRIVISSWITAGTDRCRKRGKTLVLSIAHMGRTLQFYQLHNICYVLGILLPGVTCCT